MGAIYDFMSTCAGVIAKAVVAAATSRAPSLAIYAEPILADATMYTGMIGAELAPRGMSGHYHTKHTLIIERDDIQVRRDVYVITVCNLNQHDALDHFVQIGWQAKLPW